MKQSKSCSNCMKGTSLPVNKDILCREKGIVSPDYVCRKHKFMPDSKTFKEMSYKCMHCDFFLPSAASSQESEIVGTCKLFSIRSFHGNERNACSKFIKKPLSSVS